MRTAITIIVPSTTFLLLTMVGMGLTREDFARLRERPGLIVFGLAGPLVLLPPLALGLTWVFRAEADVTAGVLLIAACPIGGISNTWSYLARASTALSVTLTGLSCLLAGITIPLLGRFFGFALGGAFRFEAPLAPLLAQTLIVLAAPVVVGMWIRSRAPEIAARHGPLLQRVAFSGVGVLLALIVLDDPVAFAGELSTAVPLAGAFVLTSMAVGWWAAVIAASDVRDRFTLAAEFGTRNTGVATVIAVTVLGRVEFARFAATYFVTEIPLMLAAVWLYRRYVAPGEARPRGSVAVY